MDDLLVIRLPDMLRVPCSLALPLVLQKASSVLELHRARGVVGGIALSSTEEGVLSSEFRLCPEQLVLVPV